MTANRQPIARLFRLVALLLLPLGRLAASVLITLPRRMNELALSSATDRSDAEVMASLVSRHLEPPDPSGRADA
jgi:hypothetical protein